MKTITNQSSPVQTSSSEHMPWVSKWLRMSQDQVLDKFQGIKGAFTDGVGQKRFVYIRGTRKDKALLVAHADTVWENLPINLDYHDGILFSKKDARKKENERVNKHNVSIRRSGVGIGADDRAGCAIVWALRGLGHSILISSGEEKGCISTRRMMNSEWWTKEINDRHSFAVQFDRRGNNDIVFYDVASKEFAKYVKSSTGYIPQSGSFTDIRYLCKTMCGVNMSVGYYDEHTERERLVIDQWQNTLSVAQKWLQQDTPRFAQIKGEEYSVWSDPDRPSNKSYTPYNRGAFDYGDDYFDYSHWNSNNYNPNACAYGPNARSDNSVIPFKKEEPKIICPTCKEEMTQDEWYGNMFNCTNCKNAI